MAPVGLLVDHPHHSVKVRRFSDQARIVSEYYMGLVRRTSLTTSKAEIGRNTHAHFGFRRHGGICPLRSTVSATALGTRHLLILGQTPDIRYNVI